MARPVASVGWWAMLAGIAMVGLGALAWLVASIQGMGVQPGLSLADGFDVGLLPWMDVGSWLIPIGGLFAALGGGLAVWSGGRGAGVRLLSTGALAVVAFWGFVTVFVEMATRIGPDGRTSSSNLATVVYSNSKETVVLLLTPAAVIVLSAIVARRRTA